VILCDCHSCHSNVKKCDNYYRLVIYITVMVTMSCDISKECQMWFILEDKSSWVWLGNIQSIKTPYNKLSNINLSK